MKGREVPRMGQGRRYAQVIAAMAVVAAGAFGFTPPAFAATAAPGLTVHTVSFQGDFPEGSANNYQVTVTNAGSEATPGPVVVTDRLPVGFSVVLGEFNLFPVVPQGLVNSQEPLPAGGAGGGCSQAGTPAEGVTVTCRYFEGETEKGEVITGLPSDTALAVNFSVTATAGAHTGTNTASATAPGAPEASVREPLVVGSLLPSFGPRQLSSLIAGVGGEPDHQAGDHPYEVTTRIDLNSVVRIPPNLHSQLTSVQDVKDVIDDLPPGVVGDAQATPKCTFPELTERHHCPFATRVGQIVSEPTGVGTYTPLFNMVPEHGVAAEFGFFDILKATHVIYAGVAPTPSGYVVRASTRWVPQINLFDITATFYGNPAVRDEDQDGEPQIPFFTNPSDCSTGQPRVSSVLLDSWQEPGTYNDNGTPAGEPLVETPGWVSATSSAAESPPVTGCNLLRFEPSMTAQPDTTAADSPTGLNFDLKVPQAAQTQGSLATPPLKNATVVMPAGMTLDPSAANGLEACSVAQIGWLGANGPKGEPLPNKGVTNFTAAAPSCPDASKIGSVEVISPLTENPLVGSVYLARQQENPFGSLLAGYIVIDDPTTGIIVKVPGELKVNENEGPDAGQITGVFDQNPQLPFSELKLRFFGGPRGDLATPEACGTYTTNSNFEPWSAPESGPNATPSDSFPINTGCVSAFTPAFSAGTTSPQAAGFSPFVLSLSKQDDEQGMRGLAVNLPTGLIGRITGVGECSDAQVAAAQARGGLGQGAQELASPSCPESSLLGTVTTATGPGSQPLSVTGKAYLTGPYKGAPYGIAVIVPALAGPFDLGVVVIRQALYINPNDSHVTDISDPFPTIRDGIPLRIKRVDVNLNRPGFTLNPSSCAPKTITATATSIPGAQAALSSNFQAAGCQGLPFAPKLTASAAGKGSKANGTTLDVNVTSAGLGQANIARVALTLPKALPSRLTTIQKACLAAVFEANPASCDEGSVIGMATIRTPLLPNPLSGPAYLVSHGGAAFPDVEFVLQGNGVTIVLDGKTDIKKGITYSRFESAPDAPFTTFETVLPAGPHSALTANVSEKKKFSLCGETLTMPTVITGQNGAVITQTTKVPITGCPKVKALSATQLRAQKLAKALKACHKDKKKAKRQACEKQARKRYGAKAARNTKHKNRK